MQPVTGTSAKGSFPGSPGSRRPLEGFMATTQLPAYGVMSIPSQFTMSTSKYTDDELRERSVAAQEVVQEHGIPNLVEKCRSGTDAEKEKAAALLSFIATHDFICAGMITSAGGIAPLVAMLNAESGRGDEDHTIDMKEQACKTIRDMCIGDKGNQKPIALKGAAPPLLTILSEKDHPWSIREAASEALALLSMGVDGVEAPELIVEAGAVQLVHAVYKEPGCTELCKREIMKCLQNLATNRIGKEQMRSIGILQPREMDPLSDGFDGFDALLMTH